MPSKAKPKPVDVTKGYALAVREIANRARNAQHAVTEVIQSSAKPVIPEAGRLYNVRQRALAAVIDHVVVARRKPPATASVVERSSHRAEETLHAYIHGVFTSTTDGRVIEAKLIDLVTATAHRAYSRGVLDATKPKP